MDTSYLRKPKIGEQKLKIQQIKEFLLKDQIESSNLSISKISPNDSILPKSLKSRSPSEFIPFFTERNNLGKLIKSDQNQDSSNPSFSILQSKLLLGRQKKQNKFMLKNLHSQQHSTEINKTLFQQLEKNQLTKQINSEGYKFKKILNVKTSQSENCINSPKGTNGINTIDSSRLPLINDNRKILDSEFTQPLLSEPVSPSMMRMKQMLIQDQYDSCFQKRNYDNKVKKVNSEKSLLLQQLNDSNSQIQQPSLCQYKDSYIQRKYSLSMHFGQNKLLLNQKKENPNPYVGMYDISSYQQFYFKRNPLCVFNKSKRNMSNYQHNSLEKNNSNQNEDEKRQSESPEEHQSKDYKKKHIKTQSVQVFPKIERINYYLKEEQQKQKNQELYSLKLVKNFKNFPEDFVDKIKVAKIKARQIKEQIFFWGSEEGNLLNHYKK